MTHAPNNNNARRRKHWIKLVLGWIFLILGIAGLVLPFLQGILFIAIGLWLLSSEHEWAHRQRERLLARFPHLRSRVQRVEDGIGERTARIHRWWRRLWS